MPGYMPSYMPSESLSCLAIYTPYKINILLESPSFLISYKNTKLPNLIRNRFIVPNTIRKIN